jgi:UDP-N-acetylmuramoyl-tripeptide--D-alanyl-D-alanine ligase
MFHATLRDICKATNASACSPESLDTRTRGAVIDSRQVQPDDLFFAMPGSSGHGSHYAAAALQAGAAAVVSDRPPEHDADTSRWLMHEQPLAALQALGRWNRDQSDALVVGITGSVGKTTTRQMISCVLEACGQGIQSQANYNNHLGVPLTLARLHEEHDWAVVEIGASAVGEIAQLAALARPEFAVVTRVAPAHVEGFGSMQDIRRAKQELAEAVPRGGTVFLNADDPAVAGMCHATCANVVFFGETQAADVVATEVSWCANRLTFRSAGQRFEVAAPGRQFLTCAVAAVAIGREVGLRNSEIADQLAQFQIPRGRGSVSRIGGITVVDDSYNASPLSVAAAIKTASQTWPQGRRILVLGDMLELGEMEDAAHRVVGRQLAAEQIDHALLIGRCAQLVAAEALSSGASPGAISVFRDLSVLQAMLDCILCAGDLLVIKGSRGIGLERLIPFLRERSSAEIAGKAA